MSDLDQIVNVQISASSVTLTRPGFKSVAIHAYHTKNLDLIRTYKSPGAVLSDGFTLNDPAYRTVASAFKQNPRLKQVKIIRGTTAVADTKKLTVKSAVAGQKISLTLVGPDGAEHPISRTVPGASNTTAEATAVAALIDALADITATAAVADITAVGGTPGTVWYYKDLVNLDLLDQTPDANVNVDLAAANAVDSDWYGVINTIESKINNDDLITWALANNKFPMVHTADDIERNGGAVAGPAYKAASDDAYGIWSRDTINYPAAGHLGRQLALNPGSSKFNDKVIKGVAMDALTDNDKTNLENAGWNYYCSIAGVGATRKDGKCFSGEYADIIVGTAWLITEIQVDVYEVIRAEEKDPYTDAGLRKISAAVRAALKKASGPSYNLLDPGNPQLGIDPPSCTIPPVSEIDVDDRTNRHVPDIQFAARYQGAVNSTDLIGSLSF
jgi:hypothetical protein